VNRTIGTWIGSIKRRGRERRIGGGKTALNDDTDWDDLSRTGEQRKTDVRRKSFGKKFSGLNRKVPGRGRRNVVEGARMGERGGKVSFWGGRPKVS